MQGAGETHVSSVNVTFRTEAAAATSDETLAAKFGSADVLLLPYAVDGRPFTSDVGDLWRSLGANEEGLTVEVATDSDAPAELVLHGDFFELGRFLVTNIAAPILATLIANYVWQKLGPDAQRRKDARVRCEVIVTKPEGPSLSVKYDGPAEAFEDTVTALLTKSSQTREH